MVDLIDAVKGCRLNCHLRLGVALREVADEIAQSAQTTKQLFFLLSETGQMLDDNTPLPAVCFFFRREELAIEDRDLALEGNWQTFTGFPPGDWYTEAFDYERHDAFTGPRLSAIPAIERRLFKCQQDARRVYACYKLSMDRFKHFEEVAMWRVDAAIVVVKKAKKDLKLLERYYTEIQIDSLPANIAGVYKEKIRDILQLSSLTPAQANICQVLLKLDIAKLHSDCKDKLEGKVFKALSLISRYSDNLRKTKNSMINRKETVSNFFAKKAKGEVLVREPHLAVVVASIRMEYTKFRDLLSRLFSGGASQDQYRDIASRLSNAFCGDLKSLETEVEKCEPFLREMKEVEKEAETENDRGRGALTKALEDSNVAVCRIKVKVLERQRRIAALQAQLERYRSLLLIPQNLLARDAGDGFVSLPEKLLEVYGIMLQEFNHSQQTTAGLKLTFENLKQRIETEKNARRAFVEQYGGLLLSCVFSNLLQCEKKQEAVYQSPCRKQVLRSKREQLRTAFMRTKELLTKKVEDLERGVLEASSSLQKSEELFKLMQRDKLNLSQFRLFSQKQPPKDYQAKEKWLEESQTDFLEEANRLSRLS